MKRNPPWTRRGVLTGIAVGLAGCAGASSPSGPRNPPSGGERPNPGGGGDGGGGAGTPLSISDWDFAESDAGGVRVFGTITNHTDQERTTTVSATVQAPDESRTQSTSVTVPGDDEAAFELLFEMAYDTFAQNGSVTIELE